MAAAMTALTLAGGAQASPVRVEAWAFPANQVLVRQRVLRGALETTFPALRVEVQCRGLHPVVLARGGRGFLLIRCTTSLKIPDYIYHLDSQGRMYVTRSS